MSLLAAVFMLSTWAAIVALNLYCVSKYVRGRGR